MQQKTKSDPQIVVLITGGTGLIGTALSKEMIRRGAEVRILTRSTRDIRKPLTGTLRYFGWNPSTGIMDAEALLGVTHIVNLAGAGIADRAWTPARRRELLLSRTQSAECLALALQKTAQNGDSTIERIITASAIGFYAQGENLATEESPAGSGFLAEITQAWEQSSAGLAAWAPLTTLRIGLVLSAEGGLLKPLIPVTRLGLGACIGSGRQWMSWIHEKDLVRLILHALLEPSWPSGTINAVAPLPRRHLGFMQALAKSLNRPLWIALPSWPLRWVLGDRSSLILEGVLASSQKVQDLGFSFEYPELNGALQELRDRF
ncbi:MAG: TIGR01777 family oxidoreductase [Bacteroidia bacterium]